MREGERLAQSHLEPHQLPQPGRGFPILGLSLRRIGLAERGPRLITALLPLHDSRHHFLRQRNQTPQSRAGQESLKASVNTLANHPFSAGLNATSLSF